MTHSVPRAGAAAFTLIELLVVVAILAILAALLLPGLRGARQRAELIRCLSGLRQVAVYCHAYAGDFDDLPSNLDPANVFFNDADDPGVPARLGVTAAMRGHWVAALKAGGYLDDRGTDRYDHPAVRCPARLVKGADRWAGRSGTDNTPRYTYGGPGTWQHDLRYYGHNSFTEYMSRREGLIGTGFPFFSPVASLRDPELRGVVATCPAMGYIYSAAWYFFEPHMGNGANPYPNAGAGWDPSADTRWTPRAHNFVFLDGHGLSESRGR